MEHQPDSPHFTRPLTLPSGRRIEVVYFESTATVECTTDDELHRCGGCGCEFVSPVDWAPASKSYWNVTLRCPNCEWEGTGVYEQAVVDRYDDELVRGAELLTRELELLTRENMADTVERFIAALAADHIVPADF